jgi:DNA polymerase-3 subunit delta'
VWSSVHGQPEVVERLRTLAEHPVHAYLFVGPEGCGKEEAARAFAARLVSDGDDADTRIADLVLRGAFSDVTEVLREGAAVDKDEAEAVVRAAAMMPVESSRKVLVIHEVHLMADSAAVRLLKTIEEPPESTIFVLLADQIVPRLATIQSRCVLVTFPRRTDADVANALVAEGVDRARADATALLAAGNLTRARLLADDPLVAERTAAFAAIPGRLDGSGSTVAAIADELDALLDKALAPLTARQACEIAELEARAGGAQRGSGRKALADRHKRQVRQFRTDELRHGLGILAAAYRDALSHEPDRGHTGESIEAITRIHRTMGALSLNANETLSLQALLLQCPRLARVEGVDAN